MYCIHCGKENPSSARFCMHCGKAIPEMKPQPEPQVEESASTPVTPVDEETLPVTVAVQPTSEVSQPTDTQPTLETKPKPKPEPKPVASRLPVKAKSVVRERCPVCGFTIRPGIHYCEGCGIQLNHVKMHTCKVCGYVDRPGTVFCEGCGKALGGEPWQGDICTACGYPNRLGVRFCEGCGVSLQAQADLAAGERQHTVTQLRKVGFKMVKRYILPRVLGGTIGGFVLGKLGQWVFQNLL